MPQVESHGAPKVGKRARARAVPSQHPTVNRLTNKVQVLVVRLVKQRAVPHSSNCLLLLTSCSLNMHYLYIYIYVYIYIKIL